MIICDRCLDLNQYDSINDKTALFTNQDEKYEEEDLKYTAK